MTLKKTIIATIILMTVASCQQDDIIKQNINEKPVAETSKQENQDGKLILGKKRENPYSLKNMQKAVNIVSNTAKRGVLKKTKLKATHYYVVFLPENEKHMNTLRKIVDSEKYVCRSHPMDYEVIQHGAEYKDKRTKDINFPVLYASIPVSDPMPNVPYEKLEDLYLTNNDNDSDELLESASLFLTDNIGNINLTARKTITEKGREAILKEELNKKEGEPQAFWWIFRKRYYPQGRVMVQNTTTNSYDPVRNTRIQIYNWFFNSHCYTNNNGYFRSSERYSREMGVYFTWRSSTATIRTHWNELIGIRVSDKIGNISRGNNGKTFNIGSWDPHKWSKATTHNAIQKFNDYMARVGIGQRIRDLNIWVFNDAKGRGAAPMLRKYKWSNMNILFSGWLKWISPITIPLKSFLNITSSQIYPDLVFNYSSNRNTLNYERLVFHEAAHAVHAQQVGGKYWSIFARRTTDNIVSKGRPYGNGIQPSAWSGQNIALCEGWANFMENRIIFDIYPNLRADLRNRHNLEDFTMHTVPSRGEPQNWFLSGLMWDLTDRNQDDVTLVNGRNFVRIAIPNNRDRVFLRISGKHEVRALFDAMGSGEYTGFNLKRRLGNLYPSHRTRINQLFTAYGY